jgi:hypothetical protein
LTRRGSPTLGQLKEYRPTFARFQKYVSAMGINATNGRCLGLGGLCAPNHRGLAKECKAAKQLKIANTCLVYFTLRDFYGFPPAPPGAPIDWNQVAFSTYGEAHGKALVKRLVATRKAIANMIAGHITLKPIRVPKVGVKKQPTGKVIRAPLKLKTK